MIKNKIDANSGLTLCDLTFVTNMRYILIFKYSI